MTLRGKVLVAQAPLAGAVIGLGALAATHGGFADRTERLTLLAAGVALLLGLLTSSWLTHRILRPLGVLGQTARRLGQGDLEVRARVEGHDEIATLARDLNAMADQLGELRQHSLDELVRAREAARAAIEGFDDPVLILDAQGHASDANAAARALFGFDLQLPASLEAWRAAALRGNPMPADGETIRLQTHDGEHEYVARALTLTGTRGETCGVSLVLQDVTRRHRLEGLTRDLVATVAHELKTPLTSLRMALHLLAEGTAGPLLTKQVELVVGGREDAERLQALVEDLVEAARKHASLQGLDLANVEPAAIVEGALQAQRGAAQAKSLHLTTEIVPGLPPIPADRDRLTIAVSNLLANAIRHTRAGRVTVAVREVRGAVRFEVHDTGEGIPPEYQSRVFDRFFRVPGSSSRSSGLGLWIVREVVEAHGGEVGLESAPGTGSRFWLQIPLGATTAPLPDLGAQSGRGIA